MPRAGLRPGQHLACITLHERREPRRIIERPGADVDETHVGLDPREQPTLAPVAMMVPRPLAVQPAAHRLARGPLEAGARRPHRGRERADPHLLAAAAVARPRQTPRFRYSPAPLAPHAPPL